MTTETLSPSPIFKGWDNNGAPLASGKLFTYAGGTTTKIPTYTDSTGVTPNTNPIILNARGEAQVWVAPNVNYKLVLAPSTDTDPPSSPIWSVDQIVNSQLLTLYGGVDTGIVNAYVLNFAAAFTSYTDGIAIYWFPSHTNTGPSTININGIGVVNITNQDGSALLAGELPANQMAFILCKGGAFLLSTVLGAGGIITANGVTVVGSTVTANGLYLPAANTLGFTSNTTLRGTIGPTGTWSLIAATSGPTLAIAGDTQARGIAICKYKAADTAIVTNTVLANDPDLTYAIPAAGTYQVRVFANYGSAGSFCKTNVNYSGTFDTVRSTVVFLEYKTAALASSELAIVAAVTTASYTGTASPDTLVVEGTLIASTTGTLAFAWAQSISSGTACTLLKGSYMTVTQLS